MFSKFLGIHSDVDDASVLQNCEAESVGVLLLTLRENTVPIKRLRTLRLDICIL
jgi:hypothetical protein